MLDDDNIPPWAIESARFYNARKEFRDFALFFVAAMAIIIGVLLGLFIFADHWV